MSKQTGVKFADKPNNSKSFKVKNISENVREVHGNHIEVDGCYTVTAEDNKNDSFMAKIDRMIELDILKRVN